MESIIPLINGKAHEWADIRVGLFGRIVAGITSIKYDDNQQMENNYGAGNKPVSRGYGNIEFSGSITMLAEEVAAIESQAPNGRLQEIEEFPITVSYLPIGGQVTTHKLLFCKFMKNGRDANQGDKKIEVEIPLLIGDIKFK
jgi:hypothetical protein